MLGCSRWTDWECVAVGIRLDWRNWSDWLRGLPMMIATARKMTLEEFLNYDDGTETYYELVDGELVKMGAECTISTRIPVF